MKRIVKSTIPQNNIHFYNRETCSFQQNIWNELENGLWKKYLIDNRLYNEVLGETRQTEWKDVFPKIQPVYPGFIYNQTTNKLIEDRYFPNFIKDASINTFLQAAETYFHQFDGERIGVHLSGGLDSSLIICLLKYFKIPFVLVGLTSERFELRTERIVQNIIAEYGDYARLLKFEDYPYFSHLGDTPKHQYPDSCLKSNYSSLGMIDVYLKHNCSVVFTGQGGDTILVKSFDSLTENGININNEMTLPWEEDLLYNPVGIKLKSFFAEPMIIDQLYSLRYNQKVDYTKLWARRFFRELLPKELYNYCYCADFYALCLDGLNQVRSTISLLFEEADDLIHHTIFSKKNNDRLLKTDIFGFTHEQFWIMCSKISIAVWLHSLFKEYDE